MDDTVLAIFVFMAFTYAATFYWMFRYFSDFISHQLNINDTLISKVAGNKISQIEECPSKDFLYGVDYQVAPSDESE